MPEILSFVRVRPNIPTDDAGTPCLRVTNETTVEVTQPAGIRPRTYDHVFDEKVDTASIWETVGAPALACAQSGKLAVVSVYGETGSGKTYTMRGPSDLSSISQGFVGRAIAALAGDAQANLTVLCIHGDLVHDLVTGSNTLKLKVEEGTGISVQGASTVRVPTAEAGYDHVKQCITKRDETFAKGVAQEATTFLVYMFSVGAGQLVLIEECGSETHSAAPASMTPDAVKDEQAKNKLLKQVCKVWIDSATMDDPKAIGFRDTKVGRFIQPGLSAALEHNGYAAQVTCVVNSSSHADETNFSLAYAAACVKQETLKTVSEYKEMIAVIEEQMEAGVKQGKILQDAAKAEEAAALKIKAENEARFQAIAEESKALDTKVDEVKAQLAAEVETWRKEYATKKVELEKKNNEEVERMRNLAKNAPMQAANDIKKRLAEVAAEHQLDVEQKRDELDRKRKERLELCSKSDSLKMARQQRRGEETDAMKPVKDLEKELSRLKVQLANSTTPSREEGLSDLEIADKTALWELRDQLDDVDAEVVKLAAEVMQMDDLIKKKIGKPEDSEDSDDESSDGESDAGPPKETEEQRIARETREAAQRAEEAEKKRKQDEEDLEYNNEWSHFRETVQKDDMLVELLEKIMRYLEYGTNCTEVTPDGLKRRFVYITSNRKEIGVLPDAVPEGKVPQRKETERKLRIANIVGIHMGQHTPNYQLLLRKNGGLVDPSRRDVPPPVAEMDASNLHRYYYRSLGLQFNKDARFLEFVCDVETDFEAWVVTLHRATSRAAVWGKKLFIDLAPKVDFLSAAEKAVCEINHLLPVEYLAAKDAILTANNRTFVTLQDLRLVCALDLYHSQKVLECWMKPRWVVRRNMNYFHFLEDAAQRAAQEAARKAAELAQLEEDEEEEEEEE